MRLQRIVSDRLFSASGITDGAFISTATFQRPAGTRTSAGQLRTSAEGDWITVDTHAAIPCAIAPEVTGRPASSTEYQNSGPMPNSKVSADYLYLMLRGYWPGIEKSWRVVVDGTLYTGSPNPDGAEGDVWGIETDSQKTFTRLRIYKQVL